MQEKGNTSRFTNIVILSCFSVYLILLISEQSFISSFINRFGLIPLPIVEGYNYYPLLAYIFIHMDFTHLISNMFALYSVGSTLERSLGSVTFGIIFLLSGILSGLLHCVLNPSSTIPVIGASGAIFGIIAVLFLFMPFTITTALIIPLPGVVLGLILLSVETMALVSNESVGIAHDVHLYGFITGSLCAFTADYDRALRGLIIAAIVLLLIYIIGIYLNNLLI
ncbi:rhomboid family intramembrane serine protease [Candidatus Bathyarchaeota archaeon]|nr:rhomboid family intramembrane serine protease [Candidatus Bathyarchaeota archaeon]